MPLVPAVLVVWATSATCFLLFRTVHVCVCKVYDKLGGWGFIAYVQGSVISENVTSGQIIEPVVVIQMRHTEMHFIY